MVATTVSKLKVEKEPRQLSQFTLQELPVLTWMFEPENLPISIIWAYKSLEGTWHTGRVNTIRSREDLTRCWREDIWPAIAADPGSKVTLDAGSFGCIELSLAIPQSQSAEAAWWMDARLAAQFIWLSRMIEANQGQGRVPIPVSLRTTLHQCYAQISTNPSLSSSLERLATANDIPAWVFFRLQALILKVEDTNSPKLLQGL